MNMRDKYNCRWVKAFALKGEDWAITIGQTSYFSCPPERVSNRWHKHEDFHKAQWRFESWFLFKYLWYSAVFGYEKNPFEIAARKAENK